MHYYLKNLYLVLLWTVNRNQNAGKDQQKLLEFYNFLCHGYKHIKKDEICICLILDFYHHAEPKEGSK